MNAMDKKLEQYQRLDLIASAIIAETFKFRGTTYVPPGSEEFGRYVVGVGGDTVPVDSCNLYELTLHYLRSGRPFGTWIESGKIYFDYVVFFNDLEQALKCAKEHNQIAIYDILTEECIYVS